MIQRTLGMAMARAQQMQSNLNMGYDNGSFMGQSATFGSVMNAPISPTTIMMQQQSGQIHTQIEPDISDQYEQQRDIAYRRIIQESLEAALRSSGLLILGTSH